MGTKVVINAITNCTRHPALAEQFDSLFFRHQKRINQAFATEPSLGILGTIYIQFQFDGDWKGAAARLRVGRYSARHNDIQAYVAVSSDQFSRCGQQERERLIPGGVLAVLLTVHQRLDAKLTANLPWLVSQFKELSGHAGRTSTIGR